MNHCALVEELHTSLIAPLVFELFKERPYCFFLDSSMDPQRLGRYSFMGSDPFLVLSSRGRKVSLSSWGERHEIEGDPFDVLRDLLTTYALEPMDSPVPFNGGAVGYFGYDLCHFMERLPSIAVDDLHLPECCLCLYDTVVAFDHLEDKSYVVSTGFPHLEERHRLMRAREMMAETKKFIEYEAVGTSFDHPDSLKEAKDLLLHSNFAHEDYLQVVGKAREYIISGDIFQVNLSQRFEAELPVAPYELYRRLRTVNPAPFAAYLDFAGVVVASASPERFLRLSRGRVETRPIKGTRPRGVDVAQDEALADELLSSPKDRAENIMIADLERNDLGRVCCYGSVEVDELAILEEFPAVFHLTSTVVGKLRPERDCIDLLRATFPGGSITGAPKVRAMEIIDELEPTRRGVYTGSIGYLGFDGDLDLNIVIRTFIIKGNKAYFQVGGGVVYDSVPEAEYSETMDKAKGLMEALGLTPETAVKTA